MHYKLIYFRILILSCLLIILPSRLIAQEQVQRPKVGLVLSGGGAKGFAHVGVLKVLEEYNIPVDYIGGTSIGSIIGALYAVGYTAQQIEDMILSQDWESLFVDNPQRTYMPFYEKEDQDRYQLSMRFKDGKLFVPNYAITNNGVIKLFSDLTLGYHDVNDFNKLPTPFLCVAVDFQTGEEVVINSGFLPEAMASSMAIPGVFPSVKTDSTLLIDGGVRNNFPVDHVRAMGADIIIGIDVGAGMKKGEDLNKLSAIIDQLTTMLGSEKYDSNREDCDLYIKPDMSEFTTADFTHAAAVKLLSKGESRARESEDEFAALEKQFASYKFSTQAGYKSPDFSGKKMISKYKINGSRLEDEAVLGIMGISQETNFKCNLEEMQIGLERLRASMRFSSIHYRLELDPLSNDYVLRLDLEENSKNFVNFGAHYNSQDDVSLLFNGTFNNLFLRNSRISVDVKLSEVPAIDFRYNINRGSLPGLAIKYGYRRRVMSNYDDGHRIGEVRIDKNYFEINTNLVVDRYFTTGLGARFETFNLDHVLGSLPLGRGKYDYFLYRFFFEIDTRDKSYYPTRGMKYYSHTDMITDNGYELNDKFPSIITFLKMEHIISLSNLWVITPTLYTQLEYVSDNPTPLFFDTYVGGYNQPHDIVSQIPFGGLRWGEYHAKNIVMLALENRFHVANKHYVYLNGNVFGHTQSLEDLNVRKLDYKVGLSVGYSYDSLLGPMEVFFSVSNDAKLRTFVSIGYYF